MNPDGVVNSAGFHTGPVSPGSSASVFGRGFATTSANSFTVPLPTRLAGATVTVNGIEAPLFFVSPTQINCQLPVEIGTGPATIVVTRAGIASEPETFTVSLAAPGIFIDLSRPIVQNQDGSINTPFNPAPRGSVVIVWVSGIGPTEPPRSTNTAAPIAPLYVATSDVSASIGGIDAAVQFIGLAPGFIGLGQANLWVPAVADGEHPIVITVDGVESNAPPISVGGP